LNIFFGKHVIKKRIGKYNILIKIIFLGCLKKGHMDDYHRGLLLNQIP